MSKVIINSYEDFLPYVDKELGSSDFVELSQERINQFADATLDHQWIHVDVEKAKTESPFGQTIAHGYLTLSMLPYLWDQIIEVNNLERMMNYGMDKMKFAQLIFKKQEKRLWKDWQLSFITSRSKAIGTRSSISWRLILIYSITQFSDYLTYFLYRCQTSRN